MRVLVTGGAGYIGSHIVLELLEAGHDVLAIDNFANSMADADGNSVALNRVTEITGKPVPFKKVDLNDEDELEKVFQEHKFDLVIHLAGLKSIIESHKDPLKYYYTNMITSLNLLQVMKKYNVKNLTFASSATVYGTAKELPHKETTQTGVGVSCAYGQSKYFFEQILVDLGKDWNLIILRFFNPVGNHPSGKIGDDPNLPTMLIPIACQVAVGRRPMLSVFGNSFDTRDGTSIRDYVHVVDIARCHVNVIDRLEREGHVGTEIYNLGTGSGYTVLEIVAAFEKESGRKVPYKIADARPGEVATVVCDPSQAWEKLGWKAELGLEDMTRDIWKWTLDNPNGFAQSSSQ